MENQSKKHWRNFFDEKILGSWDIESDGKFIDTVVTIKKIDRGDLMTEAGKETKPMVWFDEFSKPMVINRTNFKRLQNLFGTFDADKFIGEKVILTTERVKNPKEKGTFVDALRFKNEKPVVNLPELTPDHKKFDAVVDAIKGGGYTIDQVKTKYSISVETENIIKSKIQ